MLNMFETVQTADGATHAWNGYSKDSTLFVSTKIHAHQKLDSHKDHIES